MNSIRQYIHAEVLLIIVAVVAAATSAFPYICIFLAGLLLVLSTIQSMEEEVFGWWIVGQLTVTFLLSILTESFLVSLAFYEIWYTRRRWYHVMLPAVGYVFTIPVREMTLSLSVLHILLLMGITGILYAGEVFWKRYEQAIEQTAKAVSIAAVNEMTEKKLNRELVAKNYLTEQNARLEERENISRNIHNSVGHSITAAIMTLDAADMLYDTAPMQAREKMNLANARIRESLASIRHAVRVLDTENEYLMVADLVQNLVAVTEQFEMDTMLRIRTDWSCINDTLPISRTHTEFLTGALQELLTNGVKHGNATCFTVVLQGDSGHIQLMAGNNGTRDILAQDISDVIYNGYGLKKLQTYVQKCGGTMSVSGEQEVWVKLTLPLKED